MNSYKDNLIKSAKASYNALNSGGLSGLAKHEAGLGANAFLNAANSISKKVPKKYKQTAQELYEKAKNVLQNPRDHLPKVELSPLGKKVANTSIGQSTTRLISDLANKGAERYQQLNPKQLLKESIDIAKGSRLYNSEPVQSALQKIQQHLPKAEEAVQKITPENVNNVILDLKRATGAFEGRPSYHSRQ